MTLNRRAWTVMAVTFLASIAVAINQFKVPPVMQVLMSELDISMATGGWLMSVVSVAAIILAIPTAYLLARLGPKITGLIALGCTVSGAVTGALATSVTTLLLGRAIEGIGTGLMAIVAPTVISMWFEPQDRGLPMGIWAAWVPVGNVIMFNLAHPLLAAFGWRAVWWFGAMVALLAFVLFGLVVSAPPVRSREEDSAPRPKISFGKMILNPTAWLLGLAFGAFSFSLLGYNTWAPVYLSETLGVDVAAASFIASLMFLAAIPANMTAGWLLTRTKHRNRLLTIAFLVTGVLFLWSFGLPSIAIAALYMVTLGFASNFIPTSVFTLTPETMPSPQLAGLALAVVAIGSGIGVLIGPPVLGSILNGGNWTLGSICLVIVMGFGTIASILAGQRMRAI